MFSRIANMFRVPDLRKKILFTLFIILLYRLGAFIPAPGIDTAAVQALRDRSDDNTRLGPAGLQSVMQVAAIHRINTASGQTPPHDCGNRVKHWNGQQRDGCQERVGSLFLE